MVSASLPHRTREDAMSDQNIAAIARNLAKALYRRAHDRDLASVKEVAQLQTELCAAVHDEEDEAVPAP
jgi:hypothetical protein